MTPLPIDEVLPDVVKALKANAAVVLEAPPGAGKTTRVPGALLEAGLAGQGEIVVLQPRRLATRLAAARVASERGERPGETIGYQIRFEDVSSVKTRIRFVTEGVLTRRLVSDPQLKGVGAVLLDEFHERHLAADLGLAMLRRLQQTSRPDLKLMVMSATLDAGPIAAWLGAPSIRSEGRRFEVAIEHLEREDDRPLDQQVLAALKRLVQANLDGHVLVFLPGAGEIRRASDTCADFAQRQGLELHVLHGDLPAAEQDRALKPSTRRKVILSTNVAETSVTIDGVAAVVDSGLARIATHSPWSGLPTLKVAKISKASATQRAGRAGRTRAGTCVRLYTRGDYEGRPGNDTPEIRRLDFVESDLALRSLGIRDVKAFAFFEAPPAAALEASESLLNKLGALGTDGVLTETGQRLLRFPLHPRLARLVVEAERRGVAGDGAMVAALLGERDIRLEARAKFGSGARGGPDTYTGPSDVLELLERFREGLASGARGAGLDASAMQAADRVQKQLRRLTDSSKPAPTSERGREDAVMLATLAAFPDRVAKRRKPGAAEVVFAGGGSASLDPASVVREAELLVAVDAEDRKGGVVVRLASKVDAEWLLELRGEQLGELDALQWNQSAQRVDRVTRLTFGSVVLEETRQPAPTSQEVTALLADAAVAAGPSAFCETQALVHWQCRVQSLRAGFPAAGFPAADEEWLKGALRELCDGLRSFTEVREAGLLNFLSARLTPDQARLLNQHAPERITLPGGRTVTVNYEPAKPAWIESRLQDFFGLSKGPTIGQAPLVLHLLAPNMRAVQVTTNLAGFWDRHYPAIRKELMRRYPRHSWPEEPRTAAPPAPRPPRR